MSNRIREEVLEHLSNGIWIVGALVRDNLFPVAKKAIIEVGKLSFEAYVKVFRAGGERESVRPVESDLEGGA